MVRFLSSQARRSRGTSSQVAPTQRSGRARRLASRWVVSLAAMAWSFASCTSSVQLVDERTAAPYAMLLDAENRLDQRPVSLEARRADEPSFPVAAVHVRSDAAREGPVFVLVNGVFSDARTWRFVVAPLASHADVLLVDLPGTGRSNPRSPEGLEPDAYGPRWLGDRLYRALADWQSRQERPRDLVLVGHSIAGTTLLRMLGDPELRRAHSGTRANIVGAALLAPADVGASEWDPTLVELANLSGFEVGFADAVGLLEARVSEAIARSVERPEQSALRGEVDRFLEALRDPSRRTASQAMLLRARPVDEEQAPKWAEIREIAADHGRIDVPVALVWGRHDDTLPLAMGEKLAAEIPGSKLVVIEAARHSMHQEQPLATSAALLRFASTLRPPPSESDAASPRTSASSETIGSAASERESQEPQAPR
jgi:pimeloyl-ACP methyl ester carboxylesterase